MSINIEKGMGSMRDGKIYEDLLHENGSMNESHRKEILRRFEYVKKALQEMRYGRTQDRLVKARDEVARDLNEYIPKKTKRTVEPQKKNDSTNHKNRTAPSIRTLSRWLNAHIAP